MSGTQSAHAAARVAVVVPCYDEALRLPTERFLTFAAATPTVRFVLVDDGSRDETLTVLRSLQETAPDSFEVVALESNGGKAEAVRRGMQVALQSGAAFAGYWDADLATPLEDIVRFADALRGEPETLAIYGARVLMLGHAIRRNAARHYLGRVFATAASVVLGLPVYDTQCGAKLFRNVPAIHSAFAAPFVVNWEFDVEILARLIRLADADPALHPRQSVREIPVSQWVDVSGSKVVPFDFVRGVRGLLRIRRHYSR